MTTLEQRIDNILGPWPTPDQTREGILLLARHLQRHDELVAAQWEYDGGVDARAMPDDRMDVLCRRVRALREEIAGAAEGINLADASGAGIALLTPEEFLAREGGVVPQAELDVANTTIDSLQEQLEGAWADANEHADKANKRIKELEEKLRYAEYALGVMKDADDFDADANAADQRRMKMLEERVDAKTDEINALKRRTRELEAQLEAANASYRAMHDAMIERNDTIATMDERNHELERQLAERNEDAEAGKAVREWKPKAGHIRAWIEQIRMIADGTPRYRMIWRKVPGREGHTCWHCSIADAIREYNERED